MNMSEIKDEISYNKSNLFIKIKDYYGYLAISYYSFPSGIL